MRLKLLLISLLLLSSAPPDHAFSGEGFSQIWSGFSTSLSNRSDEQRRNADIAGKILNNSIIPPGGVFSFNDLVGARDRQKGFVPAPNLNASGILEEAPGGGICQLASTIYNAALLGGLQIMERHPHSRSVGHVPPGRDATISSWRKDLKLRNPFGHPLLLRISSDNDRLNVSFRAAVAKPFLVKIISELTTLEPHAVTSQGGKGQAGVRGFTTQTRRLITLDGVEREELVSEDLYPAPSRIIAGGGG